MRPATMFVSLNGRLESSPLDGFAPGIGETLDGRRMADAFDAWAHADALASAAALDMRDHSSPVVDTDLGRVTEDRILEAVSEGAFPEAAQRLADLK